MRRGWVLSLVFIRILASSSSAWAKSVRLAWDATEDASKYELVIEKAGKPVLSMTVDRPEWKGELSPGFHAYRVRAIDAASRPGEWSDVYPIVVMPEEPAPITPKSGQTIELFSGQELDLAWKPVSGFNQYLIELKRGEEVVFSNTVSDSELRLGQLPSGTYTWSVRGMITPDPGYAALASRKWLSSTGQAPSFSVRNRDLNKPVLLYPKGPLFPSSDGRLDFRWEKVQGAAAYEIRFQELLTQDETKRGAKANEKSFRTEENSISIFVGDHGHYVWRVRALPTSSAGFTSQALTHIESEAEFSLQRGELSSSPEWELSLSSGYSLLSYESKDTSQNFHGAVSPAGVPLEGGIQHWWSPNWGTSANIGSTFYGIDGASASRVNARVLAQYQQDLSFGWYGALEVGPQLDETPFLTPKPGGVGAGVQNISLLGSSIGLRFTKLLSRRLSAEVEGRVFHPMNVVSGGNGAALSGNDWIPDTTAGGSLVYSAGAKLGYRLGISWESSSISWSSSGSGAPDRTSGLSGISLLLGVIYRFGDH